MAYALQTWLCSWVLSEWLRYLACGGVKLSESLFTLVASPEGIPLTWFSISTIFPDSCNCISRCFTSLLAPASAGLGAVWQQIFGTGVSALLSGKFTMNASRISSSGYRWREMVLSISFVGCSRHAALGEYLEGLLFSLTSSTPSFCFLRSDGDTSFLAALLSASSSEPDSEEEDDDHGLGVGGFRGLAGTRLGFSGSWDWPIFVDLFAGCLLPSSSEPELTSGEVWLGCVVADGLAVRRWGFSGLLICSALSSACLCTLGWFWYTFWVLWDDFAGRGSLGYM